MGDSEPLVNALHPSVVNRLDPQFVEIYNKYQAPYLRADQVSYEEYNKNRSKYTFPICPGPKPEVGNIKIYNVPVSDPVGEIKVQVFHPTEDAIAKWGLKSRDGKLPAHLDFHGGGFVIGGLESDESWCRQACEAVGCIILNVDYRLAPDYPHPIPHTDSWAALKWTFDNAGELGIDSSRVSVGGMSAGAHIAAVLSLLARDDPSIPRLALQILVVPLVDVRFIPPKGSTVPEDPYDSHKKNEFAPCLPLHRIQWFYKYWLGDDIEIREKIARDFKASPILAKSHANIAPASIHVAGVDSLTSEGHAYHKALTNAGSSSSLKVYEGCGHPFAHMDGELAKAKEYVQDTIAALKKAYSLDKVESSI